MDKYRLFWVSKHGLIYLSHHCLAVGYYILPNNVPLLSYRRNLKTNHIWDVVCCPLYLPYLLPPPYDGDPSPIVDLHLRRPYGIDGDMPSLYILCQISILEDPDPNISLMQGV